jgi:hypothetical protein
MDSDGAPDAKHERVAPEASAAGDKFDRATGRPSLNLRGGWIVVFFAHSRLYSS